MPPRCLPLLLHIRSYTTPSSKPIVHIPSNSSIYAFGSPARSRTPLIHDISWTVREGDAWAVVSGSGSGGGGKGAVFKTLLGHTRIAPPTQGAQAAWAHAGGLYPFLSSPSESVDPYTKIALVSFRQRSSGGGSGAFFDYTARYGALWEAEDRVTLRGSLGDLTAEKKPFFEELTSRMGLEDLLDLPLLALSNGQTRRARIVKAILDEPEVLLLDEPLTGLDPPSRSALTAVLAHLHEASSPRIRVIIGLRKGEHIPAWVTHVLEVGDGRAVVRSPGLYYQGVGGGVGGLRKEGEKMGEQVGKAEIRRGRIGEVLVDMKGVNVSYRERKVLQNINWQIRQGERWHLQGANGSGKTTLLALLTGDHPQSYTQRHLLLPSFSPSSSSSCSSTNSSPSASPSSPSTTPSDTPNQTSETNTKLAPAHTLQPRKRTPTAHLRRLIGVVSPEMFDAFPRRHPGMSVWEAVGTGFDGGFVPRTRGAARALGTKEGGKGDKGGQGGVGWVDVSDEEVDLALASGLEGVKLEGVDLKGKEGKDGLEDEDEERREEVRKCLREWRVERCWEVLSALGPAAYAPAPSPSPSPSSPSPSPSPSPSSPSSSLSPTPALSPSSQPYPTPQTIAFARTPFTSLAPGEQRLVLLMRALVGRPPIVLLDEVWSGMDGGMVRAARAYLRGEGESTDEPGEEVEGGGAKGGEKEGQGMRGVDETQAVVVITHWEEEVPWEGEEVRRFKLG
ncbi:unnamed protein product [Cyclocybe aegerita]|uniref:ABC transporter domain-containing protein n=1 Tax=Cyclocybe aegerita TaxID=1973307 RepID=A0A8S0WAH5_CYCAE|nr:unnamed protein product [Cyclocybe aegerita]